MPLIAIPIPEVPLPFRMPFDVKLVCPVPPFETDRVPVTPVLKGKPVALVKVAALGVPRFGVTNVGELESKTVPDPLIEISSTNPDPEVLPNNLLVFIY